MKLGNFADDVNEMVKAFGRDINIDCNDANGLYTKILGVTYQAWEDSDGKRHETVAIVHKGHDSDESLTKE